MPEHPIQGLMKTAMENIREMVDVNTIVGDPVSTPDGSTILRSRKRRSGSRPAAARFPSNNRKGERPTTGCSPIRSEAAAAGVSITPIAFLVVGVQGVKVVPLDGQTHLLDRIIDSACMAVDRIQMMMKNNRDQRQASDELVISVRDSDGKSESAQMTVEV